MTGFDRAWNKASAERTWTEMEYETELSGDLWWDCHNVINQGLPLHGVGHDGDVYVNAEKAYRAGFYKLSVPRIDPLLELHELICEVGEAGRCEECSEHLFRVHGYYPLRLFKYG